MLPSPADGGRSGRSWPGRSAAADGQPGSAAHEGLLTAPLAEALVASPPEPDRLVDAGIRAGGCFVRVLPLDLTCAAAARRFFREGAAGIGLPADLVHDGVTMASELAANTLHAQADVEFSGSKHRAVSGLPELLALPARLRRPARACLQGLRFRARLERGRAAGNGQRAGRLRQRPRPSGRRRAVGRPVGLPPEPGSARCLEGAGQGRLVALRIPPAADPALRAAPELEPGRAMDELEAMLADRGLAGGLVRADEPGGSIWCCRSAGT